MLNLNQKTNRAVAAVFILSLGTVVAGARPAKAPVVLSAGVQEVLKELEPISLSEAQVRKIAGKDRFKPFVLNPVVTTGMETRKEWDAGALGTPCVIKVDGVFHMYYEAWGSLDHEGTEEGYASLQIGHAVSLDGVRWAKDPANPVVRGGQKDTWTEHGTWDPFVIYEDGKFKMWFGGMKDRACDWGYAESTDGSSYDVKKQLSHLGGLEDLHVTHDPKSGEYRLYYWDRDKAPWDQVMDGVPSPSGLMLARGPSEMEIDFENAQRLMIEGQEWPSKYSHVIPHGDGWAMFFGEAVIRGKPSSTGLAFSDDGIHWKKAAFPLVKGHDAEVVEAAPDLWLIYYGPDTYFDWPECDIRLAVYEGKLENLNELTE